MGLPLFGAESRLDDASPATIIVAPGEDTSFPKANVTDDRLFTLFKWTGSAPFDLITDAGVGNTADVDYFGLVGHDIFTQGGTIEFDNSPDNITYAGPTIFTVTPTDDKIILRTFTKVTDRFFRLRITGASAPPSIGQASWGLKVEVPFGMPRGFDPNAERLRLRNTVSQSGNILGAVGIFTERAANLRLRLMPGSFVNGTTIGQFREFWDNHASLGNPFFWSWNAGNPGSFEKDAFFAVVENDASIARPLATQLDVGFRDIQFSVLGLKE